MYITNIDSIPSSELYKCKKIMAEYLQKNYNQPLLNIMNNNYYFYKTDDLRKAIDKIPFWIKLLNN